jgi:lipoprotein-anchoring transpeptidase ErfK/SrfK
MRKLSQPSYPLLRLTALLTALCWNNVATSATYTLPADGNDQVGETQTIQLANHTSLRELVVTHRLGYDAVAAANDFPLFDELPAGTHISLPTSALLPDVRRTGIVINLPELRLYYFHEDGLRVSVYPIGIGKSGWETPLMESHISDIRYNPTWTPPMSIRAAMQEQGITLPAVVPAGPQNPLGTVAMRIGETNILIHGNSNPEGVGRRVSAGCIRMYEEHVQELAGWIEKGTPVAIINQPIKWGKHDNDELLEAHRPLAKPPNSSVNTADHPDKKRTLHQGFTKAARVSGTQARHRAEQFAYLLQTKNRLFNGLPKRINP